MAWIRSSLRDRVWRSTAFLLAKWAFPLNLFSLMLGRCLPFNILNFWANPISMRTMWLYWSSMILSSLMSVWTYPCEWKFWMHSISSIPIMMAFLFPIRGPLQTYSKGVSRWQYTMKLVSAPASKCSAVATSSIFPWSRSGTMPLSPFVQIS